MLRLNPQFYFLLATMLGLIPQINSPCYNFPLQVCTTLYARSLLQFVTLTNSEFDLKIIDMSTP